MDICLNENDKQYFGELFTNLIDSESKVSLNKAMDLFNTCQLSSDNLEKVIFIHLNHDCLQKSQTTSFCLIFFITFSKKSN